MDNLLYCIYLLDGKIHLCNLINNYYILKCNKRKLCIDSEEIQAVGTYKAIASDFGITPQSLSVPWCRLCGYYFNRIFQ
jgi:hypothetical protein